MRAIAIAIYMAGFSVSYAIRGKEFADAHNLDQVYLLILFIVFNICLLFGI